jgi:protein-S-isoprenylcysteine O-methyltransferase Ste14
MLLMFGFLIAALFISAGRVDLPFFWAYIGVLFVSMTIGLRLVDPDLMRERVKPGPGGTDRSLRLRAMPLLLAHLIIAGLDAGRFRWTQSITPAVQIAALVVLAAGMALSLWAMHVNRFFSPVVRIQSERGHHVITGGPYRFIRHPGYLAALLMMLAGGPALGSWWSMVPQIPMLGMILRRVLIEDRFLHAELDGYGGYAQRVRHRLIPGIW